MKILSGRELPEPCVLAVGKFESIHRGHQALIDQVTRTAKDSGIASAVVAFTPHPYRVLGDGGYKPLFTHNERAFLLERSGVDYLLEYPFDEALISTDPTAFGSILFERLHAHTIIVGEGYRFGHKREGTVQTLIRLAEHYGRNVGLFKAYTDAMEDLPVSTSSIRALLDGKNNDNKPQLEGAAALLGFPFFTMGTVTPGRRLGRELGFPTLNLYPPTDKYLPRFGVYATRTIMESRVFDGITNIGLRPTVNNDETVPTVETHLFDFNEDAYGREIRVEFLRFVREERRFDSLDELKNQICTDAQNLISLNQTTTSALSHIPYSLI
ncbi:MAG: riboflavin biosynthesis protein RibF [Defluviitaleaceae bacterium]|nr:riboflavin biosynthesis protein RibF [Defluviitaleaceae bacterium]